MVAKHTQDELKAFAEAFAAIVAEGYPVVDKRRAGKGQPGATAIAAARMRLSPSGVSLRKRRAAQAGFAHLWLKAEEKRLAAENARVKLKVRKVNATARRRRVVLMTAAQDETELHAPFWANLTAYARHLGAEIMVGGFTYQKGLFEDHSVRAGVYASDLVPLLRPVETRLSPGLLWCGQANILPTAANPLTGWGTHGGHASLVVPHAKIALATVPVMPGRAAKLALSTGVATVPNYIRRNAGMKAEWHHTIGFAIAEIAPDGTHWLRNVSADRDGGFQDLDCRVENGKVRTGRPVEAITWGDIHWEKLDPAMSRMGWGIDPEGRLVSGRLSGRGAAGSKRLAMLDALRPRFQFFHDLIDFSARNYHNRADPVFLAARHAAGAESVEAEIEGAARWLKAASRPWCRSVVIDSNHNDALVRWLRSDSGRLDPANSAYWHSLNAEWHAAVRAGEQGFNPFAAALRATQAAPEFDFVAAGDSFTICADTAPIEAGLHGHLGPNGARGSASTFARMAPRVNTAHSHAPAIREAAYVAGTNSRLLMGYNLGPSAWAHADIVTMPTGKRQIVIKNENGWRMR